MTDPVTPYPTTVTIPIRAQKGGEITYVTVVAEPTGTPGLVVTPEVRGAGLSGNWQVTHTASGLAAPTGEWGGVDVHTARRIAKALGETGVDWTADRDTLVGQLKDAHVAVAEAIKRGKYPPLDGRWDGDGDKPVGPGGWPNTAEQATAKQLAGAYTQAALQRSADNWQLCGYDKDDKAAMQVFVQNASAMIAEYGVVFLLRVLAGLDQDAADAAARDLWEACESGDSMGEWLSEWGREYGIPTPEGDREIPGLTPPPALEYDAVLRAPLMYEENGTVGSMRRTIARTAYLGQQRFGALSDEMIAESRAGNTEPWPRGKTDAHLIAHGCSFYGWALVGLLGWLAKEYPLLAIRAARMVDDIGTNGGNGYCEDIEFPPAGEDEVAPVGSSESETTR